MGFCGARILVWVAISSSRGSSQPRDWIWVSHIAGRFFTIWATGKPRSYVSQLKSLRAEKIKKFKKSHRPQWRLRPQVLQLRRWAARLSLKIGKKTADTGGALKTEYKLFSHSVVSDSLWPHGLQHTRPPCPSPPPRTCSNSCPPTISSSVAPFSCCPQSFPETE